MSVEFASGYESGNHEGLQASSGTLSVQSTTKRSGTYALRTNPTTTAVGWARYTLDAAVATAYYTIYFRPGTLPASGEEIFFRAQTSGAATKFELRVNSAGNVLAYNAAGTLVATGTTVLSTSDFTRVDIKVGSSATVGAYEVKLNRVSEFSGTTNTNATSQDRFQLGKAADTSSQTVDFYFDDIYVDNADYVSGTSLKILALTPDANGTYQTFTIGAGSGSHYQIVDEIPHNSNTDYLLSTGSTGDAETENFSSTSGAGISGDVKCVIVTTARVRNGGTNGSYKHRVRSGSTNSDSAAVASTGAYVVEHTFHSTDPATSAAWTPSAIDSMEAGVVENSPNTTRVSQIIVHVAFDDAAVPRVWQLAPTGSSPAAVAGLIHELAGTQ